MALDPSTEERLRAAAQEGDERDFAFAARQAANRGATYSEIEETARNSKARIVPGRSVKVGVTRVIDCYGRAVVKMEYSW